MRLTVRSLVGLMLVLVTSTLWAADGLVQMESAHSVERTTDRLVHALKDKGMTVFRQVDHRQGAAGVNLSLRPTRIVIFGNPKVGTPLMQCQQSVAIDLPQKALIWEDADGQVWLGYNDPAYLTERHDIDGCDAVVGKIGKALDGFARAATSEGTSTTE
ncbi:YD repeat-containing protein [Tamilnaduibacter salinus]|uniref:YD repeat-containing protein n=1 Tax=Tamilnaduibacter salinus TaxID=1484056 RepID=A0A2A2I534_9GAMM|nr:DUF302 domain-containing protein [Tamilnaduibacter salinus]PAV26849.1 hypothetical protein CF392_03270 [Tamilnaduibacter salinus]PVY77507.1 YD repeat-containing protein [Tamilnaduibacter salinus]